MIKNFFSNALLSVFMDKKARDKLKGLRDKNKAKPSPHSSASALSPDPVANSLPSHNIPQPKLSRDETRLLLNETLEAAQKELENPPKLSKTLEAAQHVLENKPTISNERQALIQNALNIHKNQSKLLDNLDTEQKEKLKQLAFMAFNNGKSS